MPKKKCTLLPQKGKVERGEERYTVVVSWTLLVNGKWKSTLFSLMATLREMCTRSQYDLSKKKLLSGFQSRCLHCLSGISQCILSWLSTRITPRKLRARLPIPKQSQDIYTLTHNQDVQTILSWQFMINIINHHLSWCSHLNFQQVDRSRNYFIILWAASAKKERRRYFSLEEVRVQLISHTGLQICN